MTKISRAVCIGSEFTDLIIYDQERDSIILTLANEFIDHIVDEYDRYGYTLVHDTKFKDDHCSVCVFIKTHS